MTSSSPASSIRLGSYQLFERLGEGASGQVYRGQGPDGPVAVKVLRAGAELDDAARARFRREARALGEVRAPELVRLLDHGLDDELGPYLVLPLVPGRSLRRLAGGLPLAPEAAILLAAPVARAAAALHAAGFVHRDLKPENAIATPAGDVVVVDLGLAWAEGMTRWTEEGAAVGSVGYMAPEQVEGQDVTPAADVWAIGVMIYEWTCGRRPFARGRASEEAAAVLVGATSPLTAASRRAGEELGQLVAACLARDPAARPTATALAAALEGLIDWIEPGRERDERAAVIADPEGYVARVAPFRARRLERLAKEAMAARRPFAALALLDRALAYAPERAELEALVAEVETAAAEVVPPRVAAPDAPGDAGAISEPPASGTGPGPAAAAAPSTAPGRAPRRWVRTAIAVGAGAVVATLITLAIKLPDGPTAPAAGSSQQGDIATWMTAVGAFDHLIQHAGQAAREQREANAAAGSGSGSDSGRATVHAGAEPPGPAGSPLDDLPPIPPDQLHNDDPPHDLASMAARPGEALIPTDALGGNRGTIALSVLDGLVAADPDDADRQVARAMGYVAAGRSREGVAMLDKVVRTHPTSQAAWAMKAFVEVRRGRWRAAEDAFTHALSLDPRDAKNLTNRGILRSRLGHTRDAYQDLRAALALDPRDTNAMRELDQIYQRAGHGDALGKVLARIAQLDPEDAAAWLDLSTAQPAADALVSVERALALDPSSERGRQRRCALLTELQSSDAAAACKATGTAGAKARP
jgi:tetratricopeptide (TPR) repeat protein/tRNA A-37 threonylcarbamoyl transferase component Bud32